MTPVRTWRAWAATLVLGGMVFAQNQLGTGHALDANLQQGSGGVNSARIDGRINSGNAVVTGNVSGLQYFHGDVGYTAPAEFRGDLAGDALFRFRAQSYGPIYSTAPTNLDLGSQGAPVEIYRMGASPSVGRISPTGQIYGFRTFDPTGVQVFQPTRMLTGTPLGASPVVGSPLGLVQTERGWVQVQASPLLGVRQQPIAPARVPTVAQQRQAVGAWLPGEAPDGTELEFAPPAAVRGPATARPTNALPAPQVPPSLLLGAQLQGRLDEQMRAPSQVLEQSVQALRNRLTPSAQSDKDKQDEEETRGPTAYVNLLRQLRAGRTPRPPAGSPQEALQQQEAAMEGKPAEKAPSVVEPQPGQPAAPGPEPTINLRQPTREELERAEKERQDAIRRASGLGQQPVSQDQASARSDKALPAELQQLLEKVDYRLPPVASMAGQAQGSLAEAYRAAEAALAKGQYFPAMEQYRQIQQRWPNEPMARAGQVHAALGAGMVRTAALSLRRLLEQHPELIAVRYEARLLPNEERLQWVRDQLQEMALQGASPDAGLMLAYLGYQSNAPALVRYGLDLAQTIEPQDPLLALLRQIWTREGATEGGGGSAGP